MPFIEVFALAAEDAAAAETTAAAAETASAAEAASAAGAAEAGTAAAGAAGASELAGLSQIGGSAASQLTPAIQSATAIGGEGAGGAGIQTAMEGAMQKAPLEFTGALPEGAAYNPPVAGPGIQVADATGTLPQGITQAAPQTGISEYWTSPNAINGSYVPGDPLNTSGIVQAGDLTATNPYPVAEAGQTYDSFGNVVQAGSTAAGNAAPGLAETAGSNGPSAWEQGWNKFEQFADKHPFMTGAALYTGAQRLGWLNPNSAHMPNQRYEGPLSKYRLSDDFQAGSNSPNTNQYRPTYPSYAGGGIMDADQNYPQADLPHPGGYSNAWQSPSPREPFAGSADTPVDGKTGEMQQMASGGIAHYAKGNLTETLDFYKKMMEPSTASGASAPHSGGDAGIYYDMDPDTRYQDALTAAQIRQSKLNKRANMQLPSGGVMKRPTPMGSLNLRAPGAQAEQAQSSLDPENAAHGGIMQARHSTLGGYAAGGNPRLLKGPGDGMSDNIPATIAGKQPARLADGEFVVPADVVSHLGNGSTDAGAKKLHEMMTEVRKARTGNPKQGKQINPRKFMPK